MSEDSPFQIVWNLLLFQLPDFLRQFGAESLILVVEIAIMCIVPCFECVSSEFDVLVLPHVITIDMIVF